VVELASRFAEEHEVHVFANEIEAGEGSKIHFHHVPAWRGSALGSILSFAVGATLAVRGRFDIIHNQGLCGFRGNVFTAHICNRAWHIALRKTSGNLTFREWVSGTTLGALEHLFYRTARNCQIIAVSNRIARDLKRCYHCRAPITVIHHGVDARVFAPDGEVRRNIRAQLDIKPDEMAFLFVGDMRKGGRQSIRALAQVPAAKLVFVSRSPDAPYRALADELGVGYRVLFPGVTNEIQKYYWAADALVLPSHYDSFGMVVTEGMAAGLPVIVSREAGASELIEPGQNGLLLDDYNDFGELAAKMRLLTGDRDFARRIGAAGRKTVETYSWDRIASETMSVYQRLSSEKTSTQLERQVRAL